MTAQSLAPLFLSGTNDVSNANRGSGNVANNKGFGLSFGVPVYTSNNFFALQRMQTLRMLI